nr:hypothetical protein [Tanacetum cinerariifolium]
MNEFVKFAVKDGKSLESVYERLTTLVNIMDRNNVRTILVSINTKFLNCLQPEWSKYVTMVRHNQTGETVSYDMLFDSLVHFKPHVLASKAKKAAKNHDPLALIAHFNVLHHNLIQILLIHHNHTMLTTAMMLFALAITQKFSTPTNNRLRTSSNTRNQAVIQDGRVEIHTKNAGYGANGNKNAGRQSRNQAFNTGNGNDDSNQIIQRVSRTESTLGKENVQCYNCNEKGHYARDCQKPRVCDAKYFREQMLLAMKDEVGSSLNNEEMTSCLTLHMTVPSYDATTVSEVNTSSKVHEQMRHEKCKTIIQTSDNDQIGFTIIFDDPYVENNSGTPDHDSNDHDEYHKIQMLAYDVQREAENQKRLNNELKKQKMLLQKELETCKERVKLFESKTLQCSKYKETCEELERELRNDKNNIDRLLKEKDNI